MILDSGISYLTYRAVQWDQNMTPTMMQQIQSFESNMTQ